MNENQPPSFPDLSMNYLSNYAWQEDSSDDQLAEMEPWEEKDLQDMLRHQLYGKRDGGDDPMRLGALHI